MKLRDLRSGEPKKAPETLGDFLSSPADAVMRAETALTEAIADESPDRDRAPPLLRDFLNAGLPQWIALASYAEMQRRGDLIRQDPEWLNHLEVWWRFVRSVARQFDRTNGVRFPD